MSQEVQRHPPAGEDVNVNRPSSAIADLESLIERVQDCERALDLTHIARNEPETDDIVFIDDLADVLASNALVNEQCADSTSTALAARYSAMVKAALHVLLQIRQLHQDRIAPGPGGRAWPER